MADDRTYIRVHDGIEDHPKIAPLSDAAFRLLVTTWGWCSRHRTDGRVPPEVWKKRGTKRSRGELEVAGLAEVHDGHVEMHDYLEHQRSSALIEEKKEAKRRGARRGNHNRWHRDAGVFDAECEFCVEEEAPPPDDDPPPPPESHDRSLSDRWSDNGATSLSDRFASPETETETEKRTTHPDTRASGTSTRDETRRGARGPTAAEAHRLVRSVIGIDFPGAVLTDLAIRSAELLQQYDQDTLVEALTEWRQRTGIGPGVLPSLVADVVKRRNGTTRARDRPSTTDQRVAAAQALKQRPTAQILQLPGAAS